MDLRTFVFLTLTALAVAAPIETDSTEDLITAEGRNQFTHSSYSAPGPLYAPSSHSYGSPRSSGYSTGRAQVTSYSRRGHSSGSDYPASKSSLDYGLRLSGPSPYKHEARQYAAPAPVYALPPSSYVHEDNSYGPGPSYGVYGPPNHISSASQLYSQDPSYDPAKDPVSQYADYVPVKEYGPKKLSDNRELSIYGYK